MEHHGAPPTPSSSLSTSLSLIGTQREAVYKNFRFNARTARQSILGMVVFPAAIFAIAYHQDVRSVLPPVLTRSPSCR